jgi:transposase
MPWSTPETLLMPVIVYSAAIQDRDGAGLVLDKIRRASLALTDLGWWWLQCVAGWCWVGKVPLPRMEVGKPSDDMKGFVVLPRRWVVERTFSWFGRNRRLAKDFESPRRDPNDLCSSPPSSFPSGASAGRRSAKYGKRKFAIRARADGCAPWTAIRGASVELPSSSFKAVISACEGLQLDIEIVFAPDRLIGAK